jgi:hypothetical protein
MKSRRKKQLFILIEKDIFVSIKLGAIFIYINLRTSYV